MPKEIESVENPELEAVEEEVQDKVAEDTVEKIESDEKVNNQEVVNKKFTEKVRDFLTRNNKETSEAEVEEEGDDIPDEFTVAARKMNWSDEQTAEFAADYTDEQLKEMIPSLLGEDVVKDDKPSEKVDVEPEQVKEEVEDSQEDERLKQALDRIAALEEAQGVNAEKSKEEEFAGFVDAASKLFDKASDEFEVFGKTEDLPTFPDGRIIPTSPQMKARDEVFGMAQVLKGAGVPSDKALEFSLNAYKGANLATEVKRSVVKDLKRKEKGLGGKRSSQSTAGRELTGPEILQEVARKHGREMPP